MPDAVLDVGGLRVSFGTADAVRGVSLRVQGGETHCLVGESGCGKSVTALAVMGLPARGGAPGISGSKGPTCCRFPTAPWAGCAATASA